MNTTDSRDATRQPSTHLDADEPTNGQPVRHDVARVDRLAGHHVADQPTASVQTVQQPAGRWILDVPKGARVHAVAERTIRLRLDAVLYYLPLAAHHCEEDIEYVHQLRVATRRAVAAIELYRALIPKKPRRRLCQQLKRIRRAAGTARDCDVLIARQQQLDVSSHRENLLEALRGKRTEAQQPLVNICQASLENNGLAHPSNRVLQKIRAGLVGKKSPRFRRWANRQLRDCVDAFFDAEPEQLDELDRLHEFRLRGKDLRYAMELLAAAFPRRFRSKLYPLVEQLQEHLGNINDHAVAIERFRGWREESMEPRQREELKKTLQSEKKLLKQTLWDFANWWTPRRSKRIQRSFAKLMK